MQSADAGVRPRGIGRVEGLAFRAQGLRFKVWGSQSRGYGSVTMVSDLEFRD